MAEMMMAGKSQAVFIATLLGGLTMGAAMLAAQPIPLPQPAPFPKTGAGAPPAGRPAAQPQQAQPPAESNSQNPLKSLTQTWLPSFFGGGDKSSAFDPKQRALADKASQYLSN